MNCRFCCLSPSGDSALMETGMGEAEVSNEVINVGSSSFLRSELILRLDESPHYVLPFSEARKKTGLSAYRFYRDVVTGRLPPPILAGGRVVGWLDYELKHAMQMERAPIKFAAGSIIALTTLRHCARPVRAYGAPLRGDWK